MLFARIETNTVVVGMKDMDYNVGMKSQKRSRFIDSQDFASLGVLTYHHIISLSYYIITV
jgi:hypothetical protein